MTGRRTGEAAPLLFAFLWPAVYLFPFLLPGGLQSRNDFFGLYFKYKVYLLDALGFAHRIPGWSASEAGGYPFLANPFAAALYPLNLPLALFYRLAGGYSVFDHQLFTVLGLCIFSSGLYAWLRESGADARSALVAALVMGTSLKMTELQRFPNAMHAAAWFPWLLLGIAFCRRPSTRARGMGLIAAATALIATAGYPYFLYYVQFLVLPYAAAILWPRTRSVLVAEPEEPARPRDTAAAALAMSASLAAPIVVCWPYLAAMRRLLSATTDRAGAGLRYATSHSSGAVDTLGSIVFPPAASPEGWFYFGQLPLLLLVLFFCGALDPKKRRLRDRWLALGVGLFVLAVTSVTWGAGSPTFRLLWETWPGFRLLRVWPRLNVIVVPALALLLARAWGSFESASDELRKGDGVGRRRLWWTCAVAVLALLSVHAAFLLSGFTHRYWQVFVGPAGTERAWAYPPMGFTIFAAFASVLLLFGLKWASRPSPRRGLIAAAFVLAAACDTGAIGLSQWAGRRAPSDLVRARADVSGAPMRSLGVPRMLIYDTIQLDAKYNAGVIANWYFQDYVAFLRKSARIAPGEKLELDRVRSAPGLAALLGLDDGRRIFLSPRLDFESVRDFVEESKRYEGTAAARIAVREYTGDALVVDVTSAASGFVCVIDNAAPGWTATVNERAVPGQTLFGTFKAVRVEAGVSRVAWKYDPW